MPESPINILEGKNWKKVDIASNSCGQINKKYLPAHI
jgi:hypothetical protein